MAIMPQKGKETIVSDLEFLVSQDPDEFIQVHILVWNIGYQPHLGLTRIPRSEIMVTFKQVGTRFPFRANHDVHV